MKLKWKDSGLGFLELEGALAWLKTPINNNKFLIVSWRMSGSEMTKAFIQENFKKTFGGHLWGKSHAVLDDNTVQKLIQAETKVVVAITDPREVAVNVLNFDNGFHNYDFDYPGIDNKNPDLKKLLSIIADKQIELINFYKFKFGDNCLVVRYEDVVYNQKKVLIKLSKFLNDVPLVVDGVNKYKSSMYKNCGNFYNFIPRETNTEHYNEYKQFYNEWGYPLLGLAGFKYAWLQDEI